jgi:chromosome segregation ATPase
LETIRVQEKCNEELARKDQEIESLKSEKNILQLKNNSLLCALEMLERELRKTKMGLNDAQQSNVALTMQYVDYKAEVTQCADNIVNSVKSRVGFLPRRIQNNICRIKSSKVRTFV